jgi:hypothetical protein
METSKRVLGLEHPSTLTSMNNLAFTWKSRGLDCHEQAIEGMVADVSKGKTLEGDST